MKLISKKFLINYSSLNVSSVVNKAISFVYVILLVRILSPESFGIYSLVWAHLGLLGAWQDLGTTSYGLLQGNTKNKLVLNNIFGLRLILSVIIFISTLVASIVINYPAEIIVIIALFFGLYLSNTVSGFLLIISSLKKELHIPAITSVVFNIFVSGANISTLLITKDIYIVLKITALCYALYGIILFFFIRKYLFDITFTFSFTQIKNIIKKSIIFSVISFFASIYFKSDFIILSKIIGNNSLAVYSAAFKFFEVPLLLVANFNLSSLPIYQELFKKERKKILSKVRKDIIFLLAISLAIVFIVWLIGPLLINTFFSNKYTNSIPLLNILIMALPFQLVSSVFIISLYANNQTKTVAFIFACLALFNVLLNILLIPSFGYYASAYLTVITELTGTLFFGYYYYKNIIKR